jgi:hypothetical protein
MRRSFLIAAVAAASLAACGGDDGLSADEYRQQANAACREGNAAEDRVPEPSDADPRTFADYLQKVVDSQKPAMDKFRELKPPEDLQSLHDDVTKLQDEQIALARGAIEDLRGGKSVQEVFTRIQGEGGRLEQRNNDLARRLGARECLSQDARRAS